ALSSRNQRLDEKSREHAVLIYRALKLGKKTFEENPRSIPEEIVEIVTDVISSGSQNRVEYVDIVDPDSLNRIADFMDIKKIIIGVGVFTGMVRLIDNIECER
ncbi:MAG: pantoate--beta-alanine ligase, partial [Gammaproteobacteria bacterium]|nr:pantoate--beta-alanine ligase [Gammaproteobacteria bacterium]